MKLFGKSTDQNNWIFIKQLLGRLGILMLIYSLLRILFHLFNHSGYSDTDPSEIVFAFIAGLRYDASAIITSNALFIVLSILPVPWRSGSGYQKLLLSLFYLINGLAIALAVSDLEYFQFNKKRISADVLSMMDSFGSRGAEFLNHFWYLFVICFLTIYLLILLMKSTRLKKHGFRQNIIIQILLFFLLAGIAFILARGGTQNRPLTPAQAAKDVAPQLSALSTNSPFTFIYSLSKRGLSEQKFMDEESCEKIFSPYQSMQHDSLRKLNVVYVILESLSREYVGALNEHKGYTPFLDSLINHSLVFTNAYASAERSNKALPAIIASLPSLMEDPFMYSAYQANCIKGLGAILKTQGYSTSFFHGGLNGEFNFDAFTRAAGYDRYYGKNEFNDDRYFDGHWGVYDEEFLQFFTAKLKEEKEPFCSAVFTLSSHHPFTIPDRLKGKFPSGENEVQESIYYTDYALQKFFDKAKLSPWFNNTLFVFVADHTFQYGKRLSVRYENRAGYFSIPVIMYCPVLDLKGKYDAVFQQTDILPTVLELLHFTGDYVSFGKQAADSSENRIAIQYLDGIYQVLNNDYILLHDGKKPLSMYRYMEDPHFEKNVLNEQPAVAENLKLKLEAYLQQYTSALVRNNLCGKRTD